MVKLYQCKGCLGYYDEKLKYCPYCGNKNHG